MVAGTGHAGDPSRSRRRDASREATRHPAAGERPFRGDLAVISLEAMRLCVRTVTIPGRSPKTTGAPLVRSRSGGPSAGGGNPCCSAVRIGPSACLPARSTSCGNPSNGFTRRDRRLDPTSCADQPGTENRARLRPRPRSVETASCECDPQPPPAAVRTGDVPLSLVGIGAPTG